MAQLQLQTVLDHLRCRVGADVAALPDCDLLARFVARREEAAFAALVQRHGPMVFGVCRRVTRCTHDAEDAWQATFLVLAEKAAAIRNRASVAAWLHGVALRVAAKVRERSARHCSAELPEEVARPDAGDELTWRELQHTLDEELQRLPDRFRQPLVLCYLQGKTRDEAAEALGWSLSTFRGRLDTAREQLRLRLGRRGVTLPAAMLAPLLTQAAGTTALPVSRVDATIHAALSGSAPEALAPLIEVGVTSMSATKLPVLMGFVLAVSLLGGGAAVVFQGRAPAEEPAAKPAAPADPKPADATRATKTFEKPPFWWGSDAFRHDGWILDADLSTDGKLLATASWGSFVVWELATGKKRLHVQELESVSSVGRDRISVVRLSPDGKQLATANKSTGNVRVWDVATGKLLMTVPWDREAEQSALAKLKVEGFDRRKHLADYHLAIEYLGPTRLLVQSTYFTATWDTAKAERVSVETHPGAYHFGITKDRKHVLRLLQPAAPADGGRAGLQLWDPEAGKAVREFSPEGQAWDAGAALSADQRYLAVMRWAGTEIALWDWQENKKVGTLEFVPDGQHDRIRTMEFSPDGKALYVGSSSGNLVVYDLATKAKVRSWKACANFLMRIHFAPEGKSVYTVGGDGLVRTWGLPDGKEVPLPDGYIGSPVFAWSRARNAMAVGDVQGRIDLWDAAGARITRTLQTKGESIVQLAFSRSGRLLAASDGKGWVHVWSLESDDPPIKFGGTEESSGWLYNVLQISDDETKLLVRTGYTVRMYRLPTAKELWMAPPKQMATFALSPNGKTVCASSFGGATALYDANTFQNPVALEQTKDMAFPGYEARFTFAPDSRVLALATPQGKMLFFDGVTGRQLAARATEDEQPLHVEYTEDGTFLIVINHTKAFLFDALQFEKLAEAPFDVTTYWRYRDATPGGAEKLLTLFRPADLPKADLETCWKKLDSPQPKEALEAIWQMSRAGELGPFLRGKIPPVAAPDGERVRKLIQELDSSNFAAREAASRGLGEVGRPAEPFLRQALKGGLSAEAAERANRLLADLQRPLTPEEVRQRRVIFVLETNATADARRTLEAWAAGAAGAHLTEQSKQALGRLGR